MDPSGTRNPAPERGRRGLEKARGRCGRVARRSGLAAHSVGKVIDNLLRNDLIICDELGFAPLGDTAAQLLFRFVAAAYERRSLRIGSHWPFESWGRFLPEHTTAVSMLDRLLHHCHTVITDGSPTGSGKPDSEEEPRSTNARNPTTRSGDFSWPPAGTTKWPLTELGPVSSSRGESIRVRGSRAPRGHARRQDVWREA